MSPDFECNYIQHMILSHFSDMGSCKFIALPTTDRHSFSLARNWSNPVFFIGFIFHPNIKHILGAHRWYNTRLASYTHGVLTVLLYQKLTVTSGGVTCTGSHLAGILLGIITVEWISIHFHGGSVLVLSSHVRNIIIWPCHTVNY